MPCNTKTKSKDPIISPPEVPGCMGCILVTWQKQNRLMDLDFADDIAILAEEENMPRDDYQA